MYRSNRTKKKLQTGKAVYGMIHSLAHPLVAEMIGLAGYDFIVIDGEHGPGGMSGHLACLQAVASTPATAILRVAENDMTLIKRALDLGVEGLLIPDIGTEQEAAAAVAACFYPPRGRRGFSAATVRASDYSLCLDKYLAGGGSELLVCLMIESANGVRNVRKIAAVDGVDVIQVGPFDLSYDLGIPGQFEHPKYLKAMDKIEAAVLGAGKILGGVPLPGLSLETVLDRGYRFITLGADIPVLAKALTGILDTPARKSRIRRSATQARHTASKRGSKKT
jgi:2-keto-3-deoxy-L-rhamnonate aldolase RhmA